MEVFIELALMLTEQLGARDKRIAELEEEVKGLKRKLNTNSSNLGVSAQGVTELSNLRVLNGGWWAQ